MNAYSRRSISAGRIARICTLTLLIAATGCAAGAKQSESAPQPAAPSPPVADFSGTWQGTFTLNMGGGDVMLVLTPEGDSYTGENTVTFEGETMSSLIYRQEFKGNTLSCWVTYDDTDVHVKGTLEGDRITGILELYMMGEFADEGTFVLIRK